MKHKESELQRLCVKAFRAKYPAFAKLLFHPKNEEASGSRSRGAISKAEGVVAGVADLILLVPSENHSANEGFALPPTYHALAIEMKTKTGRQSEMQKEFQRYAEASGVKYAIIRSYADFFVVVDEYMAHVPIVVSAQILRTYKNQQKQREEKAKTEYQKLINKTSNL